MILICYVSLPKLALPEVKVPNGMPFRNLEDEGFYVGRTPEVGLGNLSRMENRIIAAGETVSAFL